MELKLCTYNCCSLRKNIDLIRELVDDKSFDILFLQETLLLEDRLGDLAYINENYDAVGTGSVYSEKALVANAGRSEEGLACLWKRNGDFSVVKVIKDENFIGMQILIGNCLILLVNVYIKSDLWEVRALDA